MVAPATEKGARMGTGPGSGSGLRVDHDDRQGVVEHAGAAGRQTGISGLAAAGIKPGKV
jgi:hypothetical protein